MQGSRAPRLRRRWRWTLLLTALIGAVSAIAAFASSVNTAVVDTTTPVGSVTLAPGASAPITISLTVSGSQAGTATFEVFRDWTLSGGTFTGSNPIEFTMGPRAGGDPATLFTTPGTITVAAGQADGSFTLAKGATDITNSNATGAKLAVGTSSSYQVDVVTPAPVDSTPPVITPNVAGTLGDNGWYTSDVTVSFDVIDAESTISSQSADCSGVSIVADQTATTYTCTATSLGGTSSQSVTIQRDATAPTISCAPADSAWHADNVSLACTASDAPSGLADAGDASFSLSTSVSAGSEDANAATGSRSVSDAAGNGATAGPIGGNMIDRKAPSVTCDAADGNWYADNVSLSCLASDDGSGLASLPGTLSTTVAAGTEDANASTGSQLVCDQVGNCASAGPIAGNMIDRKAPDVSCGSADGVWHAADVSIGCTASDTGSGLADAGDAAFSLSTSVPAGTEDANAATGSRAVLDAVGNTTTAGPVTGNMVDRKGPSITITTPADGATYAVGAAVAASYGCSDAGSGDGTCAGTVASGANIDTTVGPHAFTVNATDAVGNPSSLTVSYTALYAFHGFFAPVDNAPMVNGIKAGSAVPVKFSLTGNQGLNIFQAGSPTSGVVTCGSTAPVDAVEQTVTAGGSSLSYDAAADQYVYVWKTDKKWAGSCRKLTLTFRDGSVKTALFKLS